MEVRDAVLAVLREETGPLHWTVIQDLALRRGYVDPFVTKDVRKQVVRALADAVRAGEVVKAGTGLYELPG
jgi:hypothetical protein